MKVLLTGALGNVGTSTLKELLKKGYNVRILDVNTPQNRKKVKKIKNKAEIYWGNLLNIADISEAVKGCDTIIHLAAMIPPQADKKPQLAEYINVGGTENVIKAVHKYNKQAQLIFTSSIAVYGDRLHSPLIRTTDQPCPNSHDYYAIQKLECERIVKASGLNWTIFRLTYIVSLDRIKLDPLMFDMPLETSIEICDTKDAGLALANAVGNRDILGKILPIAGGARCRIQYREYLNKMLEIIGIGRNFLPEKAFSKGNFHCGFMETEESQQYLKYQNHTISDYFRDVYRKFRIKRFFISLIKPLLQRFLMLKSPYIGNSP